jgi:hypothetical protein
VAACLATTGVCRCGRIRTSVANPIRSVIVAMKPNKTSGSRNAERKS